MSNFKEPQLAKDIDFSLMKWTEDNGSTRWVASPKLDGIRAIVLGGVVMSRNLIPIPNRFVQQRFGGLEWFDGELIVGDPTDPDVYRTTYSGVMTEDGQPDVRFFCFDHVREMDKPFCRRLIDLQTADDAAGHLHVTVLNQVGIHSKEELEAYYESRLAEGYEGLMLRLLHGPASHYKQGRSTAKAGPILKMKPRSDKEAIIVGMEEEMANNNEATTDNLGRTKRSSHKANKAGKSRMGKLICETIADDHLPGGIRFKIGTGFSAKERQEIWDNFETKYKGGLAKYSSLDIGVKDAPRHPSYEKFLGMRSPIDV